MHPHKESLSHLEYFEHWPLKCKLCKEYAKGYFEMSSKDGDSYNTLF